MILVNLAPIKASNGMFWYALDKIKSLDLLREPVTVLVRGDLAPLIRRELPQVAVREATMSQAMRHMVRSALRPGRTRYVTFTSHPIPFLPRQTIAFYDDYPFKGRIGGFKRLLFAAAARSSKCRVGIINRSLALPFLRGCGIPASRIFFDSAFPAVDVAEQPERSAVPASPMRIGLVGTDSLKKDYGSIFEAAERLEIAQGFHFLIYGNENDYTQALRATFPGVSFEVLSSDDLSLPGFLATIDYLVSASVREGYGRPMGLAVRLGVPLYLLKSPVFLEFFGEHAHFFDDIEALLRHLFSMRPPTIAPLGELETTALGRSPFFA